MTARLLLFLAALAVTTGCVRQAVSVAGAATGTAISTAGNVVGGTISALTFAENSIAPDFEETLR
ncbi:MAG: hypothetical protein ACU0DW_14010 [Shimia sp.]